MGFVESGVDRYDVFLSYASADNDAHNQWVSDFERYLKRTLAAEFARCDEKYRDSGSQLAICRDTTGFPEGGDLESTIDDKVRRSRFLVIFLGSGYLNSPWCLSEFDIFRDGVGGTLDAALKRLYLIVLDREALERLREGKKPDTLPQKRARLWEGLQQLTQTAIRIEDFLTEDGDLLPVYRSEDRAHPDFHQRCSPLVEELARKLIEARSRLAQESQPPHSVADAPAPVVIGAVPPRLDGARTALVESLRERAIPVESIQVADLDPKNADRMRERLRAARVLIAPFDRYAPEVVRGAAEGGHLARLKELFDDAREGLPDQAAGGLIWWEPAGPAASEAPPLDDYDKPFIDMLDALPKESLRRCAPEELADEFVKAGPQPQVTARVWIEWEESDAETVEKAKDIVRSRFDDYCRAEEKKSRRIDAKLKFGEADWTILQRQLKGKPDGVVIVYNENKDPAALQEQEQAISNMEEVLLKKMFPGMFYMRTTGMFKPTDDWSVVRFKPQGTELNYRPDELDGFVANLFDLLYDKYRSA